MRKRTKFLGRSLKPLFYGLPSKTVRSVAVGKFTDLCLFLPAWGVVLKCESQDIESANKLGKLALKLVSMFNTKSLIGRSLYVVAALLSDSKYHVRETMPRFRESYQSALKNGDLEVVCYCDKHKSQYSYFVGQELTDL